MSTEILVNITPQETRVAVLYLGVVQELHIERSSQRGLVGNIYFGKVCRVLPGLQSAFVDIGLERAAFLHVADIWEEKQQEDMRPIEQILFEGQGILVQVIKDAIGSKGARLSTQISFAGRFLVYLPHETHIGISQKIGDEAERAQLRQKLQTLIAEGDSGGYIIRTLAESANEDDLRADVHYLRQLWGDIQEYARVAPLKTLLYQDLNLALRVLRDFSNDETSRVFIDSRETYQKMLEFAQQYTQTVVSKLVHYAAERPLFDLHGVELEIERALARRVDLKSGGYLIIDQTEALTTVDVNTGGFVGARNFDDTVFKTNLEAAQAIARQLRLRNLGGMIIVDFIDMENREHQNEVLTAFKKSLSRDPTRISVHDFSPLGLIEMTRKRTRESLAHVLCEPCPTCKGRGELKTAQTVCYEILRDIVRESRQYNAKAYRILAAQAVIDLFLDEEASGLAQLSDFIAKPVSLQVEGMYTQEQYDIVLL